MRTAGTGRLHSAAATLALALLAGLWASEQAAPQEAAESGTPVRADLWPELTPPLPSDPELEARVDALLERMTLREKVGQVIQAEIRSVTPRDVRRYDLGSVLNGGGSFPDENKNASPESWLALADAFHEASTDTSDGGVGIPVIWGVDAVHGHNNVIGATIFPHNIGLGAARNPDLIRRIGEITAREVLATGLDWNFGPTVAVARDDRWGRTYESYSEDPEIVVEYARALVEGLQGAVGSPDFLGEERVIATAKHFLGDGGTFDGHDQGDTRASEEELRDVHGAPYVAALDAGAQAVMASFSSWHGRKLHGHAGLLTDVLKGRMAFDGLVVGDWNGHGQLPNCTNDNCADTLRAGLDLFMVPEDWRALHRNTLRQVRSGEIPEERLDDAVRRILRVKARAGLLDSGRPSERALGGRFELLGAPEHRDVARQAVRESLVLLKNDDGLLPLAPTSLVLVAGPAADDIGRQSGGWTLTWQGTENTNDDFPGATSIWTGIQRTVEAAGGEAVLCQGCAYSGELPDAAIYVTGETPYAEGQGDITGLEYSPADKSDVELMGRLRAAGIPVVTIFLSGRPLWTNPEINASDAFVAAWLPGSEGGGVADVIFGTADGGVAHDFRGKLSFSWPRSLDQTVLNVGDPDYDPLFPYGYGLTYADDGDLPELDETRPTGTSPVRTTDAGASPGRVLFEGRTAEGWQFYVGDEADWRVSAPDGRGQTRRRVSGVVLSAVDRNVQEDARKAEWRGRNEAQIYLQSSPIDLRAETAAGMTLEIDFLVEQAPARRVQMRMDCGYPCTGGLLVSPIFAGVPEGTWDTLQIPLRCFENSGAEMDRIDTPFLITTDGPFTLRFSRIAIAPADPAALTAGC
ncbi:MAG: glycoside hydrolase family 3 protein [Holophagales bacterium]|nr:glycoside hydrolase family 3 protein [Holophagales bacterium]MYG30021.1 glycoside hydrolase family 3 protein [Holophagales bacterium]MYI78700.1 glycoside hydrolase family 3 protein [Holophagales bacterium]